MGGKIEVLRHLINSLESAFLMLEKAYVKKNIDEFNEAKSMILKLQKKIDEEIGNGN